MMGATRLDEHPDDDPKKPRQLRHGDTLHRRSEFSSVWFRRANACN
jgi:hypothetical protein